MAKALLHIIRLRSGVTHVDATPGIGAVDSAELERLPLGNLATPREVARLATAPTVFGRRLRSGRYAVTRILPAPPEDGGPDAVDAVSLVMPSLAYARAAGSLSEFALDKRFWRLARLSVARGVDLPEAECTTPAADPRVLRAFDAWLAARRRQGVAVLAPDDAVGILAMAGWLDADDAPECRWGIGVLSLDAPVEVCTISPIAGLASTRPIVQPAVGEAWLSGEMEHAVWHLGGNPRFPPLRTLVSAVRVETARDRTVAAPRPAGDARRSRTGLVAGGFVGVAAIALAAIVIRSLGSGGAGGDSAEESKRPRETLGAGSEGTEAIDVPVRPPEVDSVARPMSGAGAGGADADGDGIANDIDCDPGDPTRGALQSFYRDFDGDGAGDPDPALISRNCVPASAPAPDGYSRRSDDLCDQNPELTSNGGCPCHWKGAIEDLDGNGVLDCLDDLDHDGKRLADDPEDDRYRLCAEAAEYFGRARRELAYATALLDEVDARARLTAQDRILKGDALRQQERAIVEPHLLGAKDAIRQGLWEIYAARRNIVFGDESFTPRSQADPSQPAPDVFPVATEEQFGLLRLFIEDLDRVTVRYVRAYARYIHMGRPQRLVREELQKEILQRWTTGTLGTNDSLEAMRWASGLVTRTDEEIEQEIRRIDDQMLRGRSKGRAADGKR